MENDEKKISQNCKDCITEGYLSIISNLFNLIRIFIYVLSAIAITSGGAEVVKNLWSVVIK